MTTISQNNNDNHLPNEQNKYRNSLEQSCRILEDFGDQLFSCLVNVAMNGELNSADDLFELGESVTFNESDFRDLDDQNAQLIMQLIAMIHKTHNSLININSLDIHGDELPF